MDAPSATVGDAPNFLDVEVDVTPGTPGDDRPWWVVVVAGWVDESVPVQPQVGQVAGDGAAADRDSVAAEFEGDSGGDDL